MLQSRFLIKRTLPLPRLLIERFLLSQKSCSTQIGARSEVLQFEQLLPNQRRKSKMLQKVQISSVLEGRHEPGLGLGRQAEEDPVPQAAAEAERGGELGIQGALQAQDGQPEEETAPKGVSLATIFATFGPLFRPEELNRSSMELSEVEQVNKQMLLNYPDSTVLQGLERLDEHRFLVLSVLGPAAERRHSRPLLLQTRRKQGAKEKHEVNEVPLE